MVLASGVILLCALLASESVHAQSQQGQGGGQQQTPGPASPSGASFSGSITPSTNAGQGEATLLAAYEIRKWSIEHQSDLLKAIGDSERVVVFTGISAPNFSDWIQLDIQMMLAKKLLLAARANAEVAIEHAKAALPPPHAPTPPSGVHPQAVLGGVPAAAAALAPQFIQILQPFFTDWTVGSLTVNVDDYVLAISAASKIKGGGKSVSVSTHLFTNNVIDELVNCTEPKPDGQTCFSELARLAMSANNQINQISQLQVALKGTNSTPTAAQSQAIADLTTASAALQSAIAGYQGLLGSISSAAPAQSAPQGPSAQNQTPNGAVGPSTGGPAPAPGGGGTPAPGGSGGATSPGGTSSPPPGGNQQSGGASGSISLANAVQEKAILDVLGKDGKAVFVHIHALTGGYITRRNIWTALGFGGLPMKVSGGAVISWAVTDSSGSFCGGNAEIVDSPYDRLDNVPAVVTPEAGTSHP